MSLSVLSSYRFRIRTVPLPSTSVTKIRIGTSQRRNVTSRKLHTRHTSLPINLLHRSFASEKQKSLPYLKSPTFLQNTTNVHRFYSTTGPTLTLPEDPTNWNAIQVFEWIAKNQYITKEERFLFEQMKLNGKDMLLSANKDLFVMSGLSIESALKILEGIKYHLQPKFILAYMNRLKPAKKPLTEIFEKEAIHALGEHEYKAKLINQKHIIKELWRSKFDHYMAFRGDDKSPDRINRVFITGAPGTGKTKFLLCSKPAMLEYAKTTGIHSSRNYENQLQEALEKGYTFFIDWNSKETPLLRFELKREPQSMIASRILWQVFQPQGITWQDFILKMPSNYSFNISDVLLACRKHFGHNVNDVVAWDIMMDNLDALADLSMSNGVVKSLYQCMARRHSDTNDVIFCTIAGASFSTIDDILFLEEPIITQVQLKSLSFAETIEHVQDLYDRGSLSFLPPNWKENQNLMTLLADAGGHPQTIHYVLKAVKDVSESAQPPINWQSVAERVYTSLSSICHSDKIKESLLSTVIGKSLVTGEFMRRQSVAVMRRMGFFTWERLTMETVDEQGLALLEPMPRSEFYRMTLPFLWLRRYIAMASPTWTGTTKLNPQVIESLLPSDEWDFLTNPTEYPLDPASWNNFIPRYEQLRSKLLLKQGETFSVLEDFYRGALGKQSWLDIEIELNQSQLVATQDNFPENLFPVDVTTKEQIDWFAAKKIIQLPDGTTFSFRRALEETKGAAPRYAAIFTVTNWPDKPLTAADVAEQRNHIQRQWDDAMKSLQPSLHPKIIEQLMQEQEAMDSQKRQDEADARMAEIRRKKREEFESKRKEAFVNAKRKWLISDTEMTFESIFEKELDSLFPGQRPKPESKPSSQSPTLRSETGKLSESAPTETIRPSEQQLAIIDMAPEQQTAWDRYNMMKNTDIVLVAITNREFDFGPVDELELVDETLYHWYNTDVEANDKKQYNFNNMQSKIPAGCLVIAQHNLSAYFGPFSSRLWFQLSQK